jgi:hypothetical protein
MWIIVNDSSFYYCNTTEQTYTTQLWSHVDYIMLKDLWKVYTILSKLTIYNMHMCIKNASTVKHLIKRGGLDPYYLLNPATFYWTSYESERSWICVLGVHLQVRIHDLWLGGGAWVGKGSGGRLRSPVGQGQSPGSGPRGTKAPGSSGGLRN